MKNYTVTKTVFSAHLYKMCEILTKGELSDHLGNVRVVLTDKRVSTYNSGFLTSVSTDISSWSDYFSFGWEIPGRHVDLPNSRYTFNGKELDREWDRMDFEARPYNRKTGRFEGGDPLANEFAAVSSYSFAANSPIWLIDFNGFVPFYRYLGKYEFEFDDEKPQIVKITNTKTQESINLNFSVTSSNSIRLLYQNSFADFATRDRVKEILGSQEVTIKETGERVNAEGVFAQRFEESFNTINKEISNRKGIELISKLLKQEDNADLKLFIVGNHQLQYGDKLFKTYGSNNFLSANDLTLSKFSQYRAGFINLTLFGNTGTAVGRDNADNIIPSGLSIARYGNDPVGITIFFNFEDVKLTPQKKKSESKKNTKKRKYDILAPRF